ncbi:ATP-binding protein [Paraburkholderia caribensis]|uniref:ATP-binding protein n=1 Tax=Paraburkholderia caribensis TaxID=75105 RepID=UPI001CC43E35|nr:ATP-binding protein [Paraburkholderia caribensis]
MKTDERVFARITDGIYREPASALRELIANAYDADATEVRIDTDAPRFSRITVRDNGHGLTEEALIHVICHIGGSLKRTERGSEFNVVSNDDPTLSPGKRKLIGKLGIGLFSISQLTHHLLIVTKVKGENVRRVCDILLMPQSDAQKQSRSEEDGFVTGKVQIQTLSAEDTDSQGTEITLLDIRGFVRESLQSTALWAAIGDESDAEESIEDVGVSEKPSTSEATDVPADDFYDRPPEPSFHIGRVSQNDKELLDVPARLPWTPDDSSKEKFEKLVSAVAKLANDTNERIRLNEVLDTYLRTIWTLSLSVPVAYVGKHPFDLTADDVSFAFALSNKSVRPKVQELDLGTSESIRSKTGLTTPSNPQPLPFEVIVDGISLSRPLRFGDDTGAVDGVRPLLFVGKIKSDMASLPTEYSGGPLEFEAYFYWQQSVVPVDHNGIMVRINGASGILFDEHFLKYQISEQNRLRQITAEIFVHRGLDAALNIDRESFNIAHPHYQFLKKWVHHALRQLITRQKSLTATATGKRLEGNLSAAFTEIQSILNSGVEHRESSPEIHFSVTPPLLRQAEDGLVFDRATVFSPRNSKRAVTKSDKLREELLERQIQAVAAVLAEFKVFDSMDPKTRDELLRKIVAIFSVDFKK